MTKTNDVVNPYIFFDGRCEEAIEFYAKNLGAERLMVMRYSDSPPDVKAQQCGQPGMENKIMHAHLKFGDATVMLSDGPCSGKYDGFALSLRAATPKDAERFFALLADGGLINMPLNKTFFSPAFGMVTDKFGIKW